MNRSTVVHALEELASLGWVLRRQGSGTIVNEGNWGRSTIPRVDWRSLFTQETLPKEPFVEKAYPLLKNPDAIDLYSGELPLSMIPDFRFPSYTWEELLLEEKKQSLSANQVRAENRCLFESSPNYFRRTTSNVFIIAGDAPKWR